MGRRGGEVDRQRHQIPQAPIREDGAGDDGRRYSDDNLINIEGVEQGTYSFMDVDTTPEPLEDVLAISPAPADEENPSDSSDESESESKEEGVKSGGGGRPRQDVDELATMDTDDDVADDEVLLPLEVPAGYSLVSTAPAALTRALVHQEILLRLGMGWFRGVITRKAQARTSDRYDFRVFSRPTAARAA